MDDGSKTSSGARLATNNFSLQDIEYLCFMLNSKFNLKTSIHFSGKNRGYIIYIKAESLSYFEKLIRPYLHPSMVYKLRKRIPLKPLNKL